MAKHVVLIPGDGIGPEVIEAACAVVEATGLDIEWEAVLLGAKALDECGTALPPAVLESIRRCGVALKGPVTTPIGTGFPSATVALRIGLDLYANLRLVKSLPNVSARYQDVDLAVVRENTEDLYLGTERWVDADTAEAVKRITRKASLRIARFAFDHALRNGRKKVTAVHKANIMKISDGLFLDCARKVAEDYAGIEYQERIVDALCLDLVLDPARHDVLLCPNLYGDIVSDLSAGLVGGLGLVPAANVGEGLAVFEAAHGSAPDIAGRGIANPTALILAAAMMLSYMGEDKAAQEVERAVLEVYRSGDTLTPDVGGSASTVQMCERICEHVRKSAVDKRRRPESE